MSQSVSSQTTIVRDGIHERVRLQGQSQYMVRLLSPDDGSQMVGVFVEEGDARHTRVIQLPFAVPVDSYQIVATPELDRYSASISDMTSTSFRLGVRDNSGDTGADRTALVRLTLIVTSSAGSLTL